MQLLKYTVAFFIVFNLVYATVIGGEPGVGRNHVKQTILKKFPVGAYQAWQSKYLEALRLVDSLDLFKNLNKSGRVIGGREFEEMSRVIRNRNSSLGREITDPSVDLVQSWQKLYETNMGRKNGQKPNMARAKLPYPRNYLFN